jgi:hypothetical protein
MRRKQKLRSSSCSICQQQGLPTCHSPNSCTGHVQEVAAWEGRGAFLYNVDAGGDIAAQALTLGHLAHIWARAGLSFSLVRLCWDNRL